MPRAGDTYSLPAGYQATTGATATAAQHNDPLEDIESVLNEATPVSKGGTGSTSAGAARTALGLAIGTNVQAHDAFLDDIAALTDPNADRILFWDDSAGDIVWLTVGSGLTLSGTTLTADDQGVSDGDKGDITVSSSGTVWTIDAGVVTLAKIAGAAKSGSDATLITGTAGTNGQFAQWNADGDIVGVSATGGVSGSANTRSAANGTAYQNTQGKPIACSMSVSINASTDMLVQISPDSSTWYEVVRLRNFDGSNARALGAQWIVPDDWYYRHQTGTTRTVLEIY